MHRIGGLDCLLKKEDHVARKVRNFYSARLPKVTNYGKIETVGPKSGRDRLREVVAFERLQLWWFGWEHFDILEKWLLQGGGRLREGDSTVVGVRVRIRDVSRFTACEVSFSTTLKLPLSRRQFRPQGLVVVACRTDHVFALVPLTADMMGSPVKSCSSAT